MALEDAPEGAEWHEAVMSLPDGLQTVAVLQLCSWDGPGYCQYAAGLTHTCAQVGVKRDEALSILSSDGVLLVLCSLIDNMPYVVAEAAVRRCSALFGS